MTGAARSGLVVVEQRLDRVDARTKWVWLVMVSGIGAVLAGVGARLAVMLLVAAVVVLALLSVVMGEKRHVRALAMQGALRSVLRELTAWAPRKASTGRHG